MATNNEGLWRSIGEATREQADGPIYIGSPVSPTVNNVDEAAASSSAMIEDTKKVYYVQPRVLQSSLLDTLMQTNFEVANIDDLPLFILSAAFDNNAGAQTHAYIQAYSTIKIVFGFDNPYAVKEEDKVQLKGIIEIFIPI